MGIDISVLMGANIANEVAAEKFCETTIGKHCLGGAPGVWTFDVSTCTYSISDIFCSRLFAVPLNIPKWAFSGAGVYVRRLFCGTEVFQQPPE